jgi:hypothetical protein
MSVPEMWKRLLLLDVALASFAPDFHLNAAVAPGELHTRAHRKHIRLLEAKNVECIDRGSSQLVPK